MKRSPLHQRTGTGGFQMQRNHLRPACRCEWRVGSENRLSPNWFRNRLSPNSFQKTTKSKLPALTRADPPPAAYRWKESGSFFGAAFARRRGGLADPVLLSPFLFGCPFLSLLNLQHSLFLPLFCLLLLLHSGNDAAELQRKPAPMSLCSLVSAITTTTGICDRAKCPSEADKSASRKA